jgi:cyclophilin family peptidyl-prolyl cis-trans isomerase
MIFSRELQAIHVLAGLALLAVVAGLVWFLTGTEESSNLGAHSAPSDASPLAACGAAPPTERAPSVVSTKPALRLERRTDYVARVQTSCGIVEIDLLEREAPRTVANFVFLSDRGFFDGLVFHYVHFDFWIQAGDPDGRPGVEPDGPGYTIPDELPDPGDRYVYGTVAMANRGGPGTAGSQFFIVVRDFEGALKGRPRPLQIPRRYAIFGRVLRRSYYVVEEIARQPTTGRDRAVAQQPIRPVYIEGIEIITRPIRSR